MVLATKHNDDKDGKHGQQLLLFECCDQQCALHLDQVQEVIAIASLSKPLGTPHILDGFLNLQEVAIPVIKLALVFGKEPDPMQLYTPLIIIQTKLGLFALRVSRLLSIVTVDIRSAANLFDQHIASSSVIVDGHTVAILATDRLLHAREMAVINEIRSLEEERVALLDSEAT